MKIEQLTDQNNEFNESSNENNLSTECGGFSEETAVSGEVEEMGEVNGTYSS